MKLRWSRPAQRNLSEVQAYIAAENPGGANATVDRIRRTTERLRAFPHSGEALDVAHLRATTVPGTFYRIIYRVEDDTILVVAIWHGAREWPFD